MELQNKIISELLGEYSFLEDFFKQSNFFYEKDADLTFEVFFEKYEEKLLEDSALSKDTFLEQVSEYIENMKAFLGEKKEEIKNITIIPGQNKLGEKETFGELTVNAGEVICIVGPTGSGKSRLLEDIEWIAQKDTPTKRQILLNGNIPDESWRFSASNKLVAQLSQNMNFIMDVSVEEFLQLHAESRRAQNIPEIIEKILAEANKLAGESFTLDTPITALSGGQSRSLMIADIAILSKSPIVLIDEIENAGVDKKQALKLLLGENKVVLMATHDPILALMGSKRIVINNGGIIKVFEVSDKERKILSELEVRDKELLDMRNTIRMGGELG